MSRVGIIGIGHGVFGRRSDATVQELAFEAFRAAMQDAGIDRDALDASLCGRVLLADHRIVREGLAERVDDHRLGSEVGDGDR